MKILLVSLFVLDRFLKYYFINQGSYVINLGVAFGVISDKPNLVFVLHFVLTILLILYFYKSKLSNVMKSALSLIILGSVSNLLDRFMYNGVVDYIDLWLFPKFNLADMIIVFGVLLLIFLEFYENYKNHKGRRVPRG